MPEGRYSSACRARGRYRATTALATIGFGIALAITSLLAQQQKPQPAAEPPLAGQLVFRGGVEYVALDVLVNDDHDHPVRDLTAKDFVIAADGRPQTILSFDHISIPPTKRTIDAKAAPQPPSDVATNLLPGRTSRAFVIVIDDGTLRPEAILQGKRFLQECLQTLTPDDRAAIVFAAHPLFSVDFSTDLARLERGLNGLDKAVGTASDARVVRQTLDNVITALAGAPESRRVLIYLGTGRAFSKQPGLDTVPTSQSFTMSGTQNVIDRAHAADVVLYSADPNGILTLNTGITSNAPPAGQLNPVRTQAQDFARELPYNTGGLAAVNVNEMSAAADMIMTDNSDYYVLGFSPSPYVADRKFHDVQVAVSTRPGLRVRARAGYLANAAAPAAGNPAAELQAGLADAQPRSDLGLRVFLAPIAPAKAGTSAVMTMDVAYPATSSPRPDDELDVAFIALNPDGQIFRSALQAFRIALSTAKPEAVTVSLDDAFDLPPGKWTVRVGVRSQILGTLGTVHTPLDVPVFSGKDLASSPLVLGLATTPALVGRPEVISALVPLQPTTKRTFDRADELKVFFRLFDSKPGNVKAALRLLDGQRVVQEIPITTTPDATLAGALTCSADLALANVPAGSYVLEMSARGSGKPATQAIPIDVR